MNDESREFSAESDPPIYSKRARWKSRLQWFAAEYSVVVVGILTALALQAWWQNRHDHTQEGIYLQQLLGDLDESERRISAADSTHRPAIDYSAKLIRAFYLPNRPPLDSLEVWQGRAFGFAEPRPIVGTAEALVSTGALSVLDDPNLRAAVTKYLEKNRELVSAQHNFADEWRRGYALFSSRVDRNEMWAGRRTQEQIDSMATSNPQSVMPPGTRRHPFGVTAEAFLTDRTAFDGLMAIHVGSMGMADARRLMLKSVRDLRKVIQSSSREAHSPQTGL